MEKVKLEAGDVEDTINSEVGWDYYCDDDDRCAGVAERVHSVLLNMSTEKECVSNLIEEHLEIPVNGAVWGAGPLSLQLCNSMRDHPWKRRN